VSTRNSEVGYCFSERWYIGRSKWKWHEAFSCGEYGLGFN